MTNASLLSIGDVAQDVARALVRVTLRDAAARVSTPLLFPCGSRIGVEISRHRNGFLVSDMGAALQEAELMGGDRPFARIAGEIARKLGVRFDQHMFFDLEVPEDELVVAVIAVANAAKSAVEATALQLAAREPVDLRAVLWARLDGLFKGVKVHRNQKLKGSSDEWTFDAVVESNKGLTLFEIVPPHANAVNGTVVKFLDIRDLGDTAPGRVAVVTSKEKTPHLALLARTAKVIGHDASDEVLRMAA